MMHIYSLSIISSINSYGRVVIHADLTKFEACNYKPPHGQQDSYPSIFVSSCESD